MALLPVTASLGNLQKNLPPIAPPVNDLDPIEIRDQTDKKVYCLLIVGRVLQTLAVLAVTACIVLACVVTPWFLFGLIPAVALGVLGAYSAGDVKRMFPVKDKPVGLVNSGQNCWVNSTLQFLLNVPSYRARMMQIPILERFTQEYEKAAGRSKSALNQCDWAESIRRYLHSENNLIPESNATAGDPADFLEFLFEGENGHQIMQSTERREALLRPEPFIQVNLDQRHTSSFQQMFNQFFDFRVENEDVSRFFQGVPVDFLVQSRRFFPLMQQVTDLNGTNRLELETGKITDPVHVPQKLVLESRLTRFPKNFSYSCDAFIEHIGPRGTGGHYICYIKKSDNTWWLCNDTSVTKVDENQVQNAMDNAYIFHFVRSE